MEKGIYMVQGYGSTEGWVVTSWHPMMGKEKMSSVGKALKKCRGENCSSRNRT